MSERVIPLILGFAPLIFTLSTIALSKAGVDPEITPEEEEKLVEEIAKSEWARRLAEAMAVTPEARERVARYLARSLVRGILRG